MLRTKHSVFAAAVALTAGLTFAAPLAQAGASTGSWANGSVAVDGRVYTPRPTYGYGYPQRQGYYSYGGDRGYYGDDDGYRGYYGRQGYYGDRGYYRERRSNAGAAAAAGIIGLTTGAIVGGALSQHNRGGVSSCTSFRSYNPATGTYVGRDGRRHYC